jgi:hypothetical protein
MAVTLTKTVKTRATRATKAKEQKAVTELLNVPSIANLLPAPVEQPVKPQKQEAKVQNGIKAPMRAGKCKHVWEVCEAIYKSTGKVPTLKELNAHEAMQGTNQTNNQIEFYRWRKYNGLNAK